MLISIESVSDSMSLKIFSSNSDFVPSDLDLAGEKRKVTVKIMLIFF